MIELKGNSLVIRFPEVHPRAELRVEFQRTLRIPDDDKTYPLPPGLGKFALEHVDDHAAGVPPRWLERGGVMLPMYQAEAMWLRFASPDAWNRSKLPYPFAIKVAAGKQCAVTGESWRNELHRDQQDYMVAPDQPWLDGFCIEKGVIRQFVAMPLGAGYSAEEQLTGKAEHGGLQIAVYPMKRKSYERLSKSRRLYDEGTLFGFCDVSPASAGGADMGLAPGGRMRQEIYDDPYELGDWDLENSSRCFVHLCNSLVWQSITGSLPPHPAPTAKQYTTAGLPWYDYYDERATAVDGAAKLAGLKSVRQVSDDKGDVALPENESVTPECIVTYRKGLQPGQVRETWL